METNPHKNMILKGLWFKNETEFNRLISAIDDNMKDEAFKIMFEVMKR